MHAAPHRLSLRVYYEDTDLAGIVYYANYLKFIERGRSEWLRAHGIDQGALRARAGIVLAVRAMTADWHAPARFDDVLTVSTRPAGRTGARVMLDQAVLRGDETLMSARVTIVALTAAGRPARIPAAVIAVLEAP